jgi:hypothetical protein
MAVRENDRRRRGGTLGEPLQALAGGCQRIEQHPGNIEPVRGNLTADIRMTSSPMKESRQDFVHPLHDIADVTERIRPIH